MQELVVFLCVRIALGRTSVIVERHAWRDDVNDRRPIVRDRSFENIDHLLRIAGEAARNETASELHGQRTEIHRRKVIDDTALELRAFVRRRRELALRQSVHAVVFDHIDDRQVAPHHVHELAESDRRRVAVAGDTDPDEVLIRQNGAGGNGRHPSVNGIEAV